MIDNRSQSLRVFFLIEIPVTERGVVIIAPFKPAVIDNKTLDAQRRRLVSHLHDVVRVMIEVDTFPGIEVHRARFAVGETDHLLAQIAVELLTHAVQATGGVAGIQIWRPQGFTRIQHFFTRQPQRFGLQIATTIGFYFRAQAVVAAPAQMHAPDIALLLAEATAACNNGREMFMRGAPAAVLQHKAVVFKAQTMRLEFTDPAAVEGHHIPRIFRHWQSNCQSLRLPY